MDANSEHLRMVEALLFAAEGPLSEADIAARLPDGADVSGHIETIRKLYSGRGVNLIKVGGKYLLRTAPDLSFLLRKEVKEQRRLSRAGVETLAIIAYHQPVTRSEIEELRGVSLSKGTLDVLMEAGWVRPRGRRRTPGRPVTYGTAEEFLVHFGLEEIADLPGMDELKAAGLLETVDAALGKLEKKMAEEREQERQAELELEKAGESAEDGAEAVPDQAPEEREDAPEEREEAPEEREEGEIFRDQDGGPDGDPVDSPDPA